MNASLIAIYMKPGIPLELSFLEELVQRGGFQLQNRQSGAITQIDEKGDFHATEAASLAARISQRKDTQFQFWEATWDRKYPRDLYCRVMFKPTTVVIEFGELPRDAGFLLEGIWSVSRSLLDNEQIIGLVVDLFGDTEEHADWHGFFMEKKPYDGPCPTLLCLRNDLARLLPNSCLEHLQSTRLHHLVVYDAQLASLISQHR